MAEPIKLSPEFALEATLQSVPVLQGKVSVLQPKKDVRPPFAFYSPDSDSEERTLTEDTGLQSWSGTLHLVSTTFRGLQLLCARTKLAIREMRGEIFATPRDDTDPGPKGKILIEDAEATQVSPDLFENEVGYFRRMYSVRLDYQTEEVFNNDD